MVLFVGTIGIIVLTLLHWIDLLARFGRVGDAIDRVEAAAEHALRARWKHPCIGVRMRIGPAPTAASVTSTRIGYLQHIDVATLERLACLAGGEIHVEAIPGDFVDTVMPIAWFDFVPDLG